MQNNELDKTLRKTHNAKAAYIKAYGKIPKEPNGRSYDIHHIDGNPFNDDPSNLVAVTIQEHYNIHYSQGDYSACHFMATQRMNKTPEQIKELSTLAANKRTADGKCVFTKETSPAYVVWTCEYCGKTGQGKGNYTRFHGRNCLQNSNTLRKKKEDVICKYCGFKTKYKSHLIRSHNENCKKNPKNKKESKIYTCLCGYTCKLWTVYIQRHEKKCKSIGMNNANV